MRAEGAWSNTNGKFKYYPGYSLEMGGDSIGAYMTYNFKQADEVLVKVGVSYVSIENARQNLEYEMPGFDFDQVKASAFDQWNEALSKIEVEGGTADERTIFYTALYHTQIHPNVLSDVNGQYPAMDSYPLYSLFVVGYLPQCSSPVFVGLSTHAARYGSFHDRHVPRKWLVAQVGTQQHRDSCDGR